MPEPSKIPAAWAWDGDINTIPATDPGNGLASWELGYPIETQTPIAAGGVPPRRQDMNGALNWLSLYSLWYQQGGLWQYDATENYEPNAIVVESNILYWCMTANGPNSTVKAPSADSAGTYWKKIINANGTLNVPVYTSATTTNQGIVELATSAETKALTDGTRAVTPSSLNGLLSLSPAALMVPKADSSAKLTGWLDAFKGGDGRVNISINGTSPQLQTARTVRVNLASTSTASFDGTTNITPGVTGTLPVGNGGTGQTNLDAVTVGKAKALNTARTVRTNLASGSAVSFDGTANITPGVTGTLGVSNGGTGQTNLDLVVVGKAKALNTARTINGTSFDGTANITTAQWGTARNVSIADASVAHTGSAVSVNGSAAVTLKLPATITASLNGNADSASTAAKLTTARAINGTNFNGTAAITTAQWGTARNVYIADATATNTGAAVSVNGSANVTLKLPATIKATLTGNADSASVWQTARNFTIKDATSAHTGSATSVNGSAAAALFLPATITAALNGNADSATKLKTARTINGTAFDGTANIIAMESSARVLSRDGYIKFQSGLILQWGQSTFSGTAYKDVTMPIPFASAVFVALAFDIITGTVTSVDNYGMAWAVDASSLSELRFCSSSSGAGRFGWIAIGK